MLSFKNNKCCYCRMFKKQKNIYILITKCLTFTHEKYVKILTKKRLMQVWQKWKYILSSITNVLKIDLLELKKWGLPDLLISITFCSSIEKWLLNYNNYTAIQKWLLISNCTFGPICPLPVRWIVRKPTSLSHKSGILRPGGQSREQGVGGKPGRSLAI